MHISILYINHSGYLFGGDGSSSQFLDLISCQSVALADDAVLDLIHDLQLTRITELIAGTDVDKMKGNMEQRGALYRYTDSLQFSTCTSTYKFFLWRLTIQIMI